MYILRPEPSLWSLLGAHAAPSQLLVHMIIGAVHLLQQAPGPIKTKNGKTALQKEFHAHDIFGNQGMSLLPWLPKEHGCDRGNCEAGTNNNTRPAALANTLCVRTLSACRVCISHAHTHRSSRVARWVGWLGARRAVFRGCFQLWRGGESAVTW